MLTVHRAERADTLVEVLAATMGAPLRDPMAGEVVAVAAHGVERWLAQRLAGALGAGPLGDGIAANIEFVTAARLLQTVIEPFSAEYGVDTEQWRQENLLWPVLAALDECAHDPALAMLARHIDAAGDDGWRGRKLATASTIARLFAAYGWQRPQMIAAWARGEDTGGAVVDDVPRPLDPSQSWQPRLWRQVREHIGGPHVGEILDDIVGAVRDEHERLALPERFSIFGPTRIPQMLRELLDALAAHRDVGLYLPHPSPALWRRIDADPAPPGPRPRSLRIPRPIENPLLASLSRDVQELQESLGAAVERDDYHPGTPAGPTTLLGALQEALRDDTSTPVADLSADASLELHACHGPERQVEVLRERLLHLFADDPTLEPRDVLIMCPNVEDFAPLITGAFGQVGSDHPAAALRVRLADRGLLATNEVLDVVLRMLALGVGRITVSELLDLAATAPVSRRFGFTADDLDNLGTWAVRANIRWGVDATQRDRYGLAGFPQGTADAGIGRLLLSVVADEADGHWLGTALPLGGIDSSDTTVIGRFAEYVDRVGSLLARFDDSRPAVAWADLLTEIVELLTAADRETEWQRAQAIRLVRDSLTGDLALAPSDVRDLVEEFVAATPTRSNFCTGELTVCSMVPMRSVPHRAIVLLGMDAEAFPRTQSVDGDDILAVDPLVGERSPRDEDRQAFLDAIVAARDHLLICYTGADPINGAPVPPSVVVSELVDAVAALAGPTVANDMMRSHTLHAFDGQNFRAPQPFSFDRSLLAGARTLAEVTAEHRVGRPWPTMASRYPPTPTADVELADLTAFVVNPADGFMRQRLGVAVPRGEDAAPDQLSVDLDGLERWGVGDRLLSALLAGADPADARAAELRRGTLPPFQLGADALAPIASKAQALADRAAAERRGPARTVDIRVELPDGRRLYGTVPDVYDDGLVSVTYSNLKAKQRLETWIALLALTAGSTEPIAGACVIGSDGRHTAVRRYAPVADAANILGALVALRDAGLATPFALPLDAAESAAQVYEKTGNPEQATNRARSRYDFDRFNHNPAVSLLLTGNPETPVTFDECAATVPADLGIATPWVPENQLSGFLRAALLLFMPLRQQEELR
ncbi:exodeoxyribonuclease V gamma chain [Gordonia araii NBRC 100433]|uniref:RecBCD enzyme subunit RecC n=1 Tax=Gordonia araii NBRC 100433 TaxID=1073574 RepID=G7H029_9ACTN|nr:exodeoxyribonuclease V subunit gamma [Gordonia araii]NNG99062.1 exodeoxyribonuclease V subunit gamma [Gordonia araii NBRC 100433]GAB09204.1 exodeoxyribonuclease V gamma chain [Gordonia araii NBRC 100433]